MGTSLFDIAAANSTRWRCGAHNRYRYRIGRLMWSELIERNRKTTQNITNEEHNKNHYEKTQHKLSKG
ncbi:hypothetical protein evm_005173 [Chilo suppressalis]|nr:hypothetical protein evm_005173 [Chilo suppressalis]